MADTKDICWVAGLLEGEGCFSPRPSHNPTIQLVMTDKDVVIRAAQVLGAHKVVQCKSSTKKGKVIYRLNLYGDLAIRWMMTIYNLMGTRRQLKIEELLSVWRNKTTKTYKNRTPYSRGATIVWQEVIDHCG